MIGSDALKAFLTGAPATPAEPTSDLPPVGLFVQGPGDVRRCVVPGCVADSIGSSAYIDKWWLKHAREDHPHLLLPKDRSVMSI